MEKGKIFTSALVGTSAMTLFSYLISKSEKINFREPEILSQLIERLPKGHSKTTANITGWGTHYAIGILFVAFYSELWEQTKVKPSIRTGAILGAVSGLAGVAGWQTMFDCHPHPPAKNLKQYFNHLMIAHIVFGIFSAVTYKALTYKSSE